MIFHLPFGLNARPLHAARPSRMTIRGLAAICLAAAGAAMAQTGNIQSVDEADRILDETAQQRAALEERYTREEYACMDKFFANACVEKVREHRRIDLNAVRDREVEANAYKRRAKVTERDAALADKATKESQDLPQRQEKQKDTEARKTEATQKKAADAGQQAQRQQAAPPLSRAAEHEAKERARTANAAAEAQKRAENVAAYEAKVREAEEHRKAVEARKAEKAKKRAEKEGAAAKPAQ